MKVSRSGVNSNGVNSSGENKRVEAPFSFKSSSSTGIHGAACTYIIIWLFIVLQFNCLLFYNLIVCRFMIKGS
jgi:hypothetical protein